MKDEIMEH